MSKKRPTESSWDSDEELLSDTTGISAFPKTSELDLLAEDGDLDEEALLGLDESGATFSNDQMQPMVNRQRSKNAVSTQQNLEPIADQAFVFEEADTGDLDDELTVNDMGGEMLGTYNSEGMESYSHDMYHQNGSGDTSHDISTEADHHHVYSADILPTQEDYKDPHSEQTGYDENEAQSSHGYSEDQSGHYSGMAGDGGLNDGSTNIELGYGQPAEQSDQVHLEYEDDQRRSALGQIESESLERHKGDTYESDSESDEDSRHNRGKFTSERTGVISLSATTEREAIPDTLEINEEQAAQIEEFMSDKSQRGKGRGGRNNRGRQSAHNRLGNRQGARPQSSPGAGGMQNNQRMGLMNQRFQSPPGPRGMPRALMSQRVPFGGMRHPMPQRGPMVGGMFNPMFGAGRGQQQPRGGGRFPGAGPMGPRGPLPMMGPGALLEPMQKILQNMRGPLPDSPRMGGPRPMQGPPGLMGMRMAGPGTVRGGHEPRSLVGSARPMGPAGRMMRPPQDSPLLMGPQLFQAQQVQLRQTQPNRGRLPPHQRLGRLGAANPGQMQDPRAPGPAGSFARAPFTSPPGTGAGNKKIFINPNLQGQQGGPSGLTRTVKMGAPVQQKKAKALLLKAKQKQIKQTASPVPVKRKSTGGDDPAAKVVKKELEEEGSSRVVEKKEPVDEETNKISSMLEEQKRKRELIQKRKELARQKQAEEKRKQLEEKMKTEGKKIESIVGGNSGSDKRTVEKSGDAAPIKVVSRSMASRLGPPPTSTQRVQLQNKGPPPQFVRGPQPQLNRGPQPQQMRGPQPQQMRGPQPQMRSPQPQMRGPQPIQMRAPQLQQIGGPQPQQMRGPQPQQMRGPQSQQMRGPQPQQMRGPQPQQMRGPQPQQIGGFQPQQMRGPQPQQIRGPSQQVRGPGPQQMGGPGLQQVGEAQPHQMRGPHQQEQQLRGPPPHQIRGPQQQVQNVQFRGPPPQQVRGPPPQQIRGPPPQQVRGPPPQQIRGPPPQQVRGPPPQQIGGPQQQFRGAPPQNIRVPPPEQPRGPGPQQIRPPVIRAPNSMHGNPIQQPQLGQMIVSPPPNSQFQTQTLASNVRHQTLSSVNTPNPRFASPPHLPPQQQQQGYIGYDAEAQPARTFLQDRTVSAHLPPAQAQPLAPQFAPAPPQQHYGDPHYPAASSSSTGDPPHGYSYPPQANPAAQQPQQPSGYQQGYPPPQQEYQQPVDSAYPAHYPDGSHAQSAVTPSYHHSQAGSQAYPGSQYESQPALSYQQTAPVYQSSTQAQQHLFPAQQQQAHYPPAQEAIYQPASDYYASSGQTIQTIQTVDTQAASSSSLDQHDTTLGQKIQTIGQRIQPVTGTQMRSIIHNVAAPAQSSAPARSVQQKTPTLHISRAVMEGNVTVLPGSQKVIILNVPQMATRETLIRLCRHFGHVEGVNLMRDQNKAVVQFQKGEQAAKCVSKCDQKCLHKTRLTVKLLPS